jgi:hypothetical protein
MHQHFGGDVAAGADAVLDHEGLAEALRQQLRNQARIEIEPAAGREADQNAHRPGRIVERPCGSARQRQGGGAGGEVKHSAAAHLHHNSPC